MSKNLLLLLLGSIGLVACGGGGGGSGGSTPPSSQYPMGYCIESSSTAIANPAIITTATSESVVYGYNNDGAYLNGTAVSISYAEHEWQPTTQLAYYSLDAGGYSSALPTGFCAMSPSSAANTFMPNSTLYFSNCTANVSNGILSFYSTYSLYSAGSVPGTGSPVSSGVFNFTCKFKTY